MSNNTFGLGNRYDNWEPADLDIEREVPRDAPPNFSEQRRSNEQTIAGGPRGSSAQQQTVASGSRSSATPRQRTESDPQEPLPRYATNLRRGERGGLHTPRSMVPLRRSGVPDLRPGGDSPTVPPLPGQIAGGAPQAGPSAQKKKNITIEGIGKSIERRLFQSKEKRNSNKLNDAIAASDVAGVNHYMGKIVTDPTLKSGTKKQNSFHKLASHCNGNADTVDQMLNAMLAGVPPASHGTAVSASDKFGNTPLHLAQFGRGIAERQNRTSRSPELNQKVQGLTRLVNRLTDLSRAVQRDQITNQWGENPEDMYQSGLSEHATDQIETRMMHETLLPD